MSYPLVATSSDVTGRVRRAKALLLLLYVGIPLCFLGGILAVSALWAGNADHRDFNYQAAIMPGAMVPVGAVVGWWQRRRTAVWAVAGAWIGGIATLVLVFYAYTMQIGEPFDEPYNLLVYTGGLLLPIGWLLGRRARRALLVPPVAALAGTPYELVYPLRGVRGVRLSVGVDAVAVQERVSLPVGGADRRIRWRVAVRHRLDGEVDAVGETALSGAEELRPPAAMERPLPSSAGPALVFDVPGGRWTLPLDDAGTIAEIVRRRAANRAGSES